MPKPKTDDPALAGLLAVLNGGTGTRPAAFDPASRKATAPARGPVPGRARWAIPGKFGNR